MSDYSYAAEIQVLSATARAELLMAAHWRVDHGMTWAEIQRRTGHNMYDTRWDSFRGKVDHVIGSWGINE